ncbi:MAG TPA: SprB repeat-containing protein, partial [Bacteroidia bacterium]|nr:SprB repeat-containing protein [Bacteroidia bacterium]
MKRKLLRAFLSASLLCLAFMASAQVSVTITGFSNCHCNGGSDGMATASASGGTAPYTYSWLPAPGSGQGTSSVSNLSPGVYTVTVHDFASNVGSQTVTITAPPALVLTPAVLGTTCGLSNGSATMNVTGGTAPYVYSWHPLACTTPTFASLSPGTYSCFVTDNNGCSAMNNATVINGAAAPTVTTNFSDVNCHGASTGNVSATVSGGTPPYAYTWSPGNYTGANYNNIAAGNYTVNVTDNAGCSGNYTVTVSEPSLALTATLTESDVHCNGGSDGSVTATASGGVAGYTYSWSPVGGFNSNVTNVAANTYTCTVTDMHGCTYTGTTIVNQPPVLTLTPSAVNATCGTNNGSATMTVAGGTAPYSYNWIPGPCSTATFSGLASGTYSCDVIDNNGCGANNQAIVNAISTPVLTMSEVDVACQGTSSGSASVTVTGGTAPFTYLWSPNGATTANNTNIPAGTYTVTVTDASGCTVGNVTSVSEPTSALTATLAKNDVHCNGGNTGVAYVTASGGTAGYTYLWSSGGTGTTEPGLTAGTYTCSVTDNNGCTYSGTIVVGEPAAIIVSTSGTPVSCNGGNDGSVTATSSGGSAPYLYSWDPGGIKSQTVTGLVAGLYTCTVTDNMECSATANYTITEPTALVLTPSSTPATCASSNGSVTMTVTGGTVPYTYSWFSGPATATFSGLAAGTYSCDVQDNNGCGANNSAVVTAISAPVLTLSQVNVPCNGTSTGSASVSVTGGVAPYTYSWSAGGSVTATDNNIPVGTYSVVVTDASGCIKSTVTTLTQPTALYSSFTKTDVICNGGSTGAATVGAAGGTPGYTYLWSP